MKCAVIVPGIYNDKLHQASTYQTGDILVTTNDYGQSLVVSGLVEEIIETGDADPMLPAKPKIQKPKQTSRSKSNPFVPR